jgi:hypothetical protein
MFRINCTHIVAANEFDSASSRPRRIATVAKDPSLFKNAVRRKYGAIRYGIADKVSFQLILDKRYNLGSDNCLFFMLDFDKLYVLDMFNLNALNLGRYDLLNVFNLNELRLRKLARMKVCDGLDLSCSIHGGRRSSLGRLGSGTSATVSHDGHWCTVVVITGSSDVHTADHSLELDKRMCLVVQV